MGAEIKRASFTSALAGIRSGTMNYEGDMVLPLLEKEMEERLARFKGLSKAEEQKLLSLTDEQRGILTQNDKKMKNEFLLQPPPITHAAVKGHPKYTNYMKMVQEAA